MCIAFHLARNSYLNWSWLLVHAQGMNPEETLVVVVSKTFTTAETMLNARTVRKWLIAQLGEWKGTSLACLACCPPARGGVHADHP